MPPWRRFRPHRCGGKCGTGAVKVWGVERLDAIRASLEEVQATQVWWGGSVEWDGSDVKGGGPICLPAGQSPSSSSPLVNPSHYLPYSPTLPWLLLTRPSTLFGPDHTVPSTPRPLTGTYSYLRTYLLTPALPLPVPHPSDRCIPAFEPGNNIGGACGAPFLSSTC